VMSTLGIRQEPVIEPFGGTTDRVEGEPQPEDAPAASASEPAPVPDPLTCPKCSSPMVRRRVKSGANAGQEFWGCSTYPKCRGIVPIHCDE
jgi:restriction system protein